MVLMGTQVCKYLFETLLPILLAVGQEVGLLDHVVVLFLMFLRNLPGFPWWEHHFTILLTVPEGSDFSASLPMRLLFCSIQIVAILMSCFLNFFPFCSSPQPGLGGQDRGGGFCRGHHSLRASQSSAPEEHLRHGLVHEPVPKPEVPCLLREPVLGSSVLPGRAHPATLGSGFQAGGGEVLLSEVVGEARE